MRYRTRGSSNLTFASLTLFIVDEALRVSCPWLPVNFGIPVALEKRETEDSGGDDGDDGGGGCGFPWIDDGDPTGKTPERKMKRYDRAQDMEEKKSETRMKNAKRRAREVSAHTSLRDVRSRHEYTGYTGLPAPSSYGFFDEF